MLLSYQVGIIFLVTPEEYEPPGFKPFDGDTAVDFDGNTVKWLCGKVTTGFHTLTLKTRLLDVRCKYFNFPGFSTSKLYA